MKAATIMNATQTELDDIRRFIRDKGMGCDFRSSDFGSLTRVELGQLEGKIIQHIYYNEGDLAVVTLGGSCHSVKCTEYQGELSFDVVGIAQLELPAYDKHKCGLYNAEQDEAFIKHMALEKQIHDSRETLRDMGISVNI